MITFRPATLNDLDTLLEFEQGVILAERPFDPTLKPGHITYYDIKGFIQSDDVEIVVGSIKEEVVSCGYVKQVKSKDFAVNDYHAYIGFMYVKPEHRGKGISQELLDELLAWAKSRNLTEVTLGVYNQNQSAIRAYEKAGFDKHSMAMRMTIERLVRS